MKDACHTVLVRLRPEVSYRIDREHDVISGIVGMTCRGLDAEARGDSGNDDLRDSECRQRCVEIGASEGAPRTTSNRQVRRLLFKFGYQLGELGGILAREATVVIASGRCAIDIRQHDGKPSCSKRGQEFG